MSTITVDFSFKKSTPLDGWVDCINSNFEVLLCEYEMNFEWFQVKNILDVKKKPFNQIKLELKEGGSVLIQKINNSLPRVYFTHIDPENYKTIVSLFETNHTHDIVYGIIVETTDCILQNIENVDSWQRKKRTLPDSVITFKNPIYTNDRDKESISLESLPGHSHIMDYGDMLWFGSCWQMYFSPIYFKYIPKPLFDNYDDCYENIILENGLRKITLYSNVMDFNLPENRNRQWTFRRFLGIDSIAHELTKSNYRIEPENLPVLITKRNCKKGQTKVSRFLDDSGILTAKNISVKIEVREYSDDGITIVLEEEEDI